MCPTNFSQKCKLHYHRAKLKMIQKEVWMIQECASVMLDVISYWMVFHIDSYLSSIEVQRWEKVGCQDLGPSWPEGHIGRPTENGKILSLPLSIHKECGLGFSHDLVRNRFSPPVVSHLFARCISATAVSLPRCKCQAAASALKDECQKLMRLEGENQADLRTVSHCACVPGRDESGMVPLQGLTGGRSEVSASSSRVNP
eukprot:5926361-Amphidinium_carterae.1